MKSVEIVVFDIELRLGVIYSRAAIGEVAEWSKAAVLKTVDGLNRPGVRIPPSPPISNQPLTGVDCLLVEGCG